VNSLLVLNETWWLLQELSVSRLFLNAPVMLSIEAEHEVDYFSLKRKVCGLLPGWLKLSGSA
jgi:hypothetical protein